MLLEGRFLLTPPPCRCDGQKGTNGKWRNLQVGRHIRSRHWHLKYALVYAVGSWS